MAVEFLFLGGIEAVDRTLAEAHRLGVGERLRLRDRVPYEEMFDYLLCADIGIMSCRPDIQNHIFAFPRKMYDYGLAGLPLIAPAFAVQVEPVVREQRCGLPLNMHTPSRLERQ